MPMPNRGYFMEPTLPDLNRPDFPRHPRAVGMALFELYR